MNVGYALFNKLKKEFCYYITLLTAHTLSFKFGELTAKRKCPPRQTMGLKEIEIGAFKLYNRFMERPILCKLK